MSGPIILTASQDSIMLTALADHTYAVPPEIGWVVAHVDEWLERSNRRRRDPERFHPSDLGQTDAEIIALFNGTAIEFHEPAQKLRIFDNGHGVHARWGRYLKKSGLTVPKHPKKFYIGRLRLKGMCDEIIAHPETGAVTIVELKSMNPFQFAKLTEPKPEHVDQLHCYMAGLRILDGILLYESKGDQSVKVFGVPFDAERWAAIEARLIRLRLEADAERLALAERISPEVAQASRDLIAAMASSEPPVGVAVDLQEYASRKLSRLLS